MRIVRSGWRYGLPPLLLAPPATLVSPPVGIACFLLGVGILLFFRDPPRSPPDEGIVSPADGRVSLIRAEEDRIRVGVFMNVTDVHVNRAPARGTIESVHHRPGAHRPAFTKDSDRNERVDIRLVGDGGPADVSLIAGTVARRITPYVEEGQTVERGQRIGHIAFGSRADVLLPRALDREDVAVSIGDRVRAGETPLVDPKAHIDDTRSNGQ